MIPVLKLGNVQDSGPMAKLQNPVMSTQTKFLPLTGHLLPSLALGPVYTVTARRQAEGELDDHARGTWERDRGRRRWAAVDEAGGGVS